LGTWEEVSVLPDREGVLPAEGVLRKTFYLLLPNRLNWGRRVLYAS
jgi:hypothetical protein